MKQEFQVTLLQLKAFQQSSSKQNFLKKGVAFAFASEQTNRNNTKQKQKKQKQKKLHNQQYFPPKELLFLLIY